MKLLFIILLSLNVQATTLEDNFNQKPKIKIVKTKDKNRCLEIKTYKRVFNLAPYQKIRNIKCKS